MTEIFEKLKAATDNVPLMMGRVFENVIEEIAREILSPGDTVVDLGAHAGRHMFPFSRLVGFTGKVVAVEAINSLYVKLLRQIYRERIENIALYNCVIAEDFKVVTFNEIVEAQGLSGINVLGQGLTNIKSTEFHTMTLDGIMPIPEKVRFIKADVEGAELLALQGGRNVIMTCRPAIVFENGRENNARLHNYTKDDFFAFFNEIEYRIFDVNGDPFTYDDWEKGFANWYFYAFPSENTSPAKLLPEIFSKQISVFEQNKGA